MDSAAARFTDVVVLPTPPFWLATVKMRVFGGRGHTVSRGTLEFPGVVMVVWADVSRETTELSASRTSGESPGLRGGWVTWVTVAALSTGRAAASGAGTGQPRPPGCPAGRVTGFSGQPRPRVAPEIAFPRSFTGFVLALLGLSGGAVRLPTAVRLSY
ncbi:hypothetical protein GCM10010140_27790 [Streptosporangium pseudovulgare]|uniref:Uncharacterized protein n=1 Tax=Streptosporangium pseudovulgare TaxID=35765 RepID=A0ABQ2QW50_9ACTN|nr:hypothetical protein GCM10010140_27790 [Streptosporangium pseudovulgare]